jgi:hypothetical protein
MALVLFLMLLGHIVILGTAAGRYAGIDGVPQGRGRPRRSG